MHRISTYSIYVTAFEVEIISSSLFIKKKGFAVVYFNLRRYYRSSTINYTSEKWNLCCCCRYSFRRSCHLLETHYNCVRTDKLPDLLRSAGLYKSKIMDCTHIVIVWLLYYYYSIMLLIALNNVHIISWYYHIIGDFLINQNANQRCL